MRCRTDVTDHQARAPEGSNPGGSAKARAVSRHRWEPQGSFVWACVHERWAGRASVSTVVLPPDRDGLWFPG